MSRPLTFGALALVMASLAACATTSFVSTWKAPDAQPLQVAGAKVAAVVMTKSPGQRRAAEDALARAIARQGAEGIASYTIFPADSPTDESAAKAAFEKAGITGVVVMRPRGSKQVVTSTPAMYAGPYYGGYWGGGYYGYGWSGAYGAASIQTDTIVSIETLVYSLKQNKLVWAGQSQTTSPTKLDALIQEVATAAASAMKKQGLL